MAYYSHSSRIVNPKQCPFFFYFLFRNHGDSLVTDNRIIKTDNSSSVKAFSLCFLVLYILIKSYKGFKVCCDLKESTRCFFYKKPCTRPSKFLSFYNATKVKPFMSNFSDTKFIKICVRNPAFTKHSKF